MQNKLKILFSVVGLISFITIINNYGIDIIWAEIQRSGFLLFLLALTFIPTLVCYSVSWLLVTDHHRMTGHLSAIRKVGLFTRFTAASIAWNNLTPFLKVGGEPLKYLMLSRYMPKKEALNSIITYNLIHLLATALSFIIGALLLPCFYDVPRMIMYSSWGFILIFIFIIYFATLLMKANYSFLTRFYHGPTLRVVILNSRIVKKRLLTFYKRHPQIFVFSLFFDTAARFIEGLTFYFGFMLIKHPISLLSSAFLDVSRTLVDTIFFFIPYQVGTREQGVRFFMEKVLFIDAGGFLTAVLFYRFVEIVWIFIGYFIWINMSKSSTEASV